MVYLAMELVGPWEVFGFSIGMEAFDELLSINGVLQCSQDLDLSFLPLVFSLILTEASRLLHLSLPSQFPLFVLASSVCWSLQCLHFFRLTCSVMLWGGRNTANK